MHNFRTLPKAFAKNRGQIYRQAESTHWFTGEKKKSTRKPTMSTVVNGRRADVLVPPLLTAARVFCLLLSGFLEEEGPLHGLSVPQKAG